jgi:hypothetical protein
MTDFKEIRNLFDVHDKLSGIPDEELAESERQLGKRIPETLRQYYLRFGSNEDINQTQDSLILPSDLKVGDDGFVIFYRENQSVWRAGLKFSEFDNENPNVYLSYDRENRNFEVGHLYNFLIAEAFLQALFALPFAATRADVSQEKEKLVRDNWKRSEVKSYLWGTEFFQNSEAEILAVMKSENQTDIFIAARSEEKFNRINDTLAIDWDYSSLENE